MASFTPDTFADGPAGNTPITAAKLNNLETAVSTVFTGGLLDTYAPQYLPAYVGIRSKRFNADHSVYNQKGSNTRVLRGKMGAVQAGTGACRIAMLGDSLTSGQSGVAGVSDWPLQLRKLMPGRGCPVGGTGFVYAYNHIASAVDPRWVYSGWALSGQASNFISVDTAGVTATFTSDVAGTVVEILTFGTSRAFTVSIDSVGQSAWTPSGASATQLISYSGLANTTHVVQITSITGASNFLVAVNVRGATGVTVSNVGSGGAQASQVASQFYTTYQTMVAGTPDVIILNFGMNEALNGVPVATFKTAFQARITSALATGADVLLWAPDSPSTTGNPGGYPAVSSATFQTYLSAIYDLADTNDLVLVDVTDRFGLYSGTSGNYADAIHLTAQGYGDIARAFAGVVAP
jgi:lysophospholipase L1-like esterase